MGWYDFRPYVSVAKRRANAAREVAAMARQGTQASPVIIEGRAIATTFWGKAWCSNLEQYSDYENRLPRGRTYVRNGSVVDLQINEGSVKALVSGSSLYTVTIKIKPLSDANWLAIRKECSGKIASLIELLKGSFGAGVMEVVTRRPGGLFPQPAEIDLDCSCPDWADMCKHVAATLYGVGARLDHEPNLLFLLRQVNHAELISGAAHIEDLASTSSAEATIADEALSDVFGIELAPPAPAPPATASQAPPMSPASDQADQRGKPEPAINGSTRSLKRAKPARKAPPPARKSRTKPADPAGGGRTTSGAGVPVAGERAARTGASKTSRAGRKPPVPRSNATPTGSQDKPVAKAGIKQGTGSSGQTKAKKQLFKQKPAKRAKATESGGRPKATSQSQLARRIEDRLAQMRRQKPR